MTRRSTILIVSMIAAGVVAGAVGIARAADRREPVLQLVSGWVVRSCVSAYTAQRHSIPQACVDLSAPLSRLDCDDRLTFDIVEPRPGIILSCVHVVEWQAAR